MPSPSLKDLAALEGKHALLQSELAVARETLEDSHLQRDLLKQEKHQLTMALEKVGSPYSEAALVGEGVVIARPPPMLSLAVEDRDNVVLLLGKW